MGIQKLGGTLPAWCCGSPGQVAVLLQSRVSLSGPLQRVPYGEDTHERERTCQPCPHVSEHTLHWDHSSAAGSPTKHKMERKEKSLNSWPRLKPRTSASVLKGYVTLPLSINSCESTRTALPGMFFFFFFLSIQENLQQSIPCLQQLKRFCKVSSSWSHPISLGWTWRVGIRHKVP